MATRPVFHTSERFPYYRRTEVDFVWNGGFSVAQKQRNITAIHTAFSRRYPDMKILEISSKSMQWLGVNLSAFNLQKYIPSLGKRISVENAYQGSKCFALGGPFTDLYLTTARQAKKDERLTSSGKIISYVFEGRELPLVPTNGFYDWLYINALAENPELSDRLLAFDAFTDVEFNPEASLNCQARAAAVYVSLARLGLLDKAKDFDSFIELITQQRQ